MLTGLRWAILSKNWHQDDILTYYTFQQLAPGWHRNLSRDMGGWPALFTLLWGMRTQKQTLSSRLQTLLGRWVNPLIYFVKPFRRTTCMVGPMCTMVLSLPIVEPTKSPTTDRSKHEPPGQWTSCLGQNIPWSGLLNLLNQLKTLTFSFSFSDGSSPRATTWLTKRELTLIGQCQHLFSFLFWLPA